MSERYSEYRTRRPEQKKRPSHPPKILKKLFIQTVLSIFVLIFVLCLKNLPLTKNLKFNSHLQHSLKNELNSIHIKKALGSFIKTSKNNITLKEGTSADVQNKAD